MQRVEAELVQRVEAELAGRAEAGKIAAAAITSERARSCTILLLLIQLDPGDLKERYDLN